MAAIKDRKVFEILRDSVLTAERALLYALGFQFRIDHPHGFIRDVTTRFRKMPDPVGSYWNVFMQKEQIVRFPLFLPPSLSISQASSAAVCMCAVNSDFVH